MKVYRVETKEITVLDGLVCDLCQRKTKGYDWRTKNGNMVGTRNNLFSVAWKAEIEIDICPTCFIEKLIPWAESQGAIIDKMGLDMLK